MFLEKGVYEKRKNKNKRALLFSKFFIQLDCDH